MERMTSNEPRLTDKIALVFGGSRGIGAAIVKQLAADGASVALTYAKSADRAAEIGRAAEALGVSAIMIKADSARNDGKSRRDGETPRAAWTRRRAGGGCWAGRLSRQRKSRLYHWREPDH